jgi:DNA-binding response OmpR family regulator
MEHQEEQKQKINTIKRALLMEDYFPCQKIMINYLRKLNYQVDLIDNGIKAIPFIYSIPYDLIIADIRLKGGPGWKVIECVRESESNAGTPLIVWSAFVNNSNDEEKYLAWGADGALVKWCLYEELENKIQQCFLMPRYKRNFIYKFKAFQKKWLETYPIDWVKNINYLSHLINEYLYWSNFHTKSEK